MIKINIFFESLLLDVVYLTLSWRRPLPYRTQSIDLRSKSMDWFLYDNGLRHERVEVFFDCLKCFDQTIYNRFIFLD